MTVSSVPMLDKSKWQEFTAERASGSLASFDVAGLIQFALRQAYLQNLEEVAYFADKVKQFNNKKKSIREQLTAKRDAKAAKGSKGSEKLDAEIAELEEKLSTVGEDAQLAQADLQTNLQRMQQTLQLSSSVSKMIHQSAMEIIRRIGN